MRHARSISDRRGRSESHWRTGGSATSRAGGGRSPPGRMASTRAEFSKTVEGAVRNSFMHSLLAKGRLLYTHDETIAALCARLHEIGERDTQLQLLGATTHALTSIDKAHKWFVTRGDLDYSALWILYAATALARIEVMGARLLADREVIPQAMKLNPAFFQTVYTGMLNAKKTRQNVQRSEEHTSE